MITPFEDLTPEQRAWIEGERENYKSTAEVITEGGESARREVMQFLGDIFYRLREGQHSNVVAALVGLTEAIFHKSEGYQAALSLYLYWPQLKGINPTEELIKLAVDQLDTEPPKELTEEEKRLAAIGEADNWILTRSRTPVMIEKFAPVIEQIRDIQRKADAEAEGKVQHETTNE